MVEKMKKIDFLVYHDDYEVFLGQLRDMGVVHVQELQKGSSLQGSGQDSLSEIKAYDDAISSLASALKSEAGKTAVPSSISDDPLRDFRKLLEDHNSDSVLLQELHRQYREQKPWGEFDPDLVRKLSASGTELTFFKCAKGKFENRWIDDYDAVVVREDKSDVYFVTVSSVSPEGIAAQMCSAPSVSLSELENHISEVRSRLESHDVRLASFASANLDLLKSERRELSSKLNIEHVRLNTDESCEGTVRVIRGWIPAKKLDTVSGKLSEMDCVFQVMDPTPDDDIPIQLSNNGFFRLFEPFTQLYMLPSYGELDLTPFFAPFFMIFFGLCLGDMGYGLLMILAMPVFDKLFKLINPDFSKWLVPIFGGSTIICGLLTGTAFGFSLYDIELPFFKNLKELFYVDNSRMFTLSLIIGCVQIIFGMFLKAYNKTVQFGFKYALSTIGWIVLLLTVAVAFVGKIGFSSPIVITLLCVSSVLIFLFNSPGKNPLLNIGLGLWDTYNMVTGLLGDVLSYVRLFALGLSGGILASVFNSLAVGMSPDVPVLGFLVTTIIFLAGHAINIFMNFLGAIVHPMRLTFVEFFKNAGYSGGGTQYRPFAEENQ